MLPGVLSHGAGRVPQERADAHAADDATGPACRSGWWDTLVIMSGTIERTDFHGLPAWALRSPDGGMAIVTDHGAHVVSWQPRPGDERLYLSDRAVFADGTPIRGGIPVIFPQFGTRGPGLRHGYARTVSWSPAERRTGPDFTTATWRLPDSVGPATGRLPGCVVELTVSLDHERLDVELFVANAGAAPLSFTAALHTYLRVPAIEEASLLGLQDTGYEDQTDGGKRHTQAPRHLRFEGEVDRIYEDAPVALELVWRSGTTRIRQTGFRDTVVWNPGRVRSAAFADMPPDGFREMVCVEAATAITPVELDAGAEWAGRQTLLGS
ncbi:MAG: D-hexose-6-phosphate mutarotase [Betaproteobacteria bacterium]|nr:D-hexose-6-phosphate mutarotase [Betaproteobacteria bacterium]